MHDVGAYVLTFHNGRRGINTPFGWSDFILTTPFFVLQPFALAAEEIVKGRWRSWKRARGEDGGDRWVLFERLVGFVWTWVWLGWSAQWYIKGWVGIGHYRRDETQREFPSIIGGLLYDRWMH